MINLDTIQYLLLKGNLPQAEIFCRLGLETEPNNPVLHYFLGLISEAVNLPRFAKSYFEAASKLAPEWELLRVKSSAIHKDKLTEEKCDKDSKRFLLIKAWGYGFWSDMDHVLGQLLITEITDRIPIIHWGKNSLFGNRSDENAFNTYFEPVSPYVIDDLAKSGYDFFPPKWNYQNLREENVNKFQGPYSRMAGLYYLNRPETVVVSDFHSGIISIRPWIPSEHKLFGLSINDLYRFLMQKYLRPKQEILKEIEKFYSKHLDQSKFISVHVRGSDKIAEVSNLHNINEQYFAIVDGIIASERDYRIFLMTDDAHLLNHFMERYGDRVVYTDCQRTINSTGVHYQNTASKHRLGVEVLIDSYIAARGNVFVGNGCSNPSCMILYLNNWHAEDIHLIGPNMHNCYNTFLHNW